jgi:Uma2 family endonuclease
MISDYLNRSLPSTEELPCSDDTPVDNEDQNFLPNVLLFLLNSIWAERFDWYFGVDMAIYHATGKNLRIPVVPDGFLSLGVERQKGGKFRRSYAVWEEHEIVPILILEMVSHTPGNEYDEKMEVYARLGVLYYLIYNPEFWQRDKHQPFEIYKLDEKGNYQLQVGEPYWMPEVGLGIGRYRGVLNGLDRELLAWFDRTNTRYLMPEESLQLERQRADRLAAQLCDLGVDPNL